MGRLWQDAFAMDYCGCCRLPHCTRVCSGCPYNIQKFQVGLYWALSLGNSAGYPGVFWDNPHPYPWKPTPLFRGVGFPGVSQGFSKTPGIANLSRAYITHHCDLMSLRFFLNDYHHCGTTPPQRRRVGLDGGTLWTNGARDMSQRVSIFR